MADEKIVISKQMLISEMTKATVALAEVMRSEWGNVPFDVIKRSCAEFAVRYVEQLINSNKKFKENDLEVLD